MARRPDTLTNRSSPPIAALAIVALMLTLMMGGWRASQMMLTGSTTQTSNAAETSLLQIIDPIVGAGNARISVTGEAEDGRVAVVLLNRLSGEVSPAQMAAVERLISAAMNVTETSADQVLIEYADFATGAPGQLTPAQYGELMGFIGLAGLLSWMALATRAERIEVRSEVMPMVHIDPVSTPPQILTPVATESDVPETAAEMIRRDPSRAADVLRGWMSGKEDAA
jgi:flagellar biosynthesis/type III secretory pathway M-ring protein FliF/YscJ